MNTHSETVAAAVEHDDGDYYMHIVGYWEGMKCALGGLLGRGRIPRALCGVVLRDDPTKPNVRPDASCPTCLTRTGGRGAKYVVPGHWVYVKDTNTRRHRCGNDQPHQHEDLQ